MATYLNLSKDEQSTFKTVFWLLDIDVDGFLTYEEVLETIQCYGYEKTFPMVKRDRYTLDEFLMEMDRIMDMSDLKKAFKCSLQQEHNTRLTVDEFKSAFVTPKFNEEQVEEMLLEYGKGTMPHDVDCEKMAEMIG